MDPTDSILARVLDFVVVRFVYFACSFLLFAYGSMRWIGYWDYYLHSVFLASIVVALVGPWVFESGHARRWGRVRDTREERQK